MLLDKLLSVTGAIAQSILKFFYQYFEKYLLP